MDNDSVSRTADSSENLSRRPPLFWVIFLFMAIQALLALIINFSRIAVLFYLLPIVSVIFCAITLKTTLAPMTSVFSKVAAAIFVILAYILATGFSFITAIFVGGLPG